MAFDCGSHSLGLRVQRASKTASKGAVELWMKGEELVCPFESMEEKAAYIHGVQGLLGRDAS